jgi:hypothetical protein
MQKAAAFRGFWSFGGGELRLMQRGLEFSIFAGSIELMSSRLCGSEEALALMTCARVLERPQLHILIGGLGMGFTLRTALAALGPEATITVAELVPEVSPGRTGRWPLSTAKACPTHALKFSRAMPGK